MLGTSLVFSPVRREDEAALAAFFAQLVADGDNELFHPHPFTPEHARQVARHEGKDLYCVASIDGKILAYGMLRGWDEGYEVPSLGIAVARAARGTGLARAFMLYLHSCVRMRGVETIRLTVYKANQPACRLYESLGYRMEPGKPDQLVGRCQLGRAA